MRILSICLSLLRILQTALRRACTDLEYHGSSFNANHRTRVFLGRVTEVLGLRWTQTGVQCASLLLIEEDAIPHTLAEITGIPASSCMNREWAPTSVPC